VRIIVQKTSSLPSYPSIGISVNVLAGKESKASIIVAEA
jgi:hypothetical protein